MPKIDIDPNVDLFKSIYIRVNNSTLNRNIGRFNLHHIWNGVLLNTPGLTIKGHAQAIGHAESTQPNTSTSLKHPHNIKLIQLPHAVFTGTMEDAQRTPSSEHVHRTSYNIYKVLNFISPSDLMKSSCGWMKASLISTNVLFQRINQLLNR